MTTGPGKYDHAATLARVATDAEAVVLAVFNGNAGSGFSVQYLEGVNMLLVADLLVQVANEIRADMRKETQ